MLAQFAFVGAICMFVGAVILLLATYLDINRLAVSIAYNVSTFAANKGRKERRVDNCPRSRGHAHVFGGADVVPPSLLRNTVHTKSAAVILCPLIPPQNCMISTLTHVNLSLHPRAPKSTLLRIAIIEKVLYFCD